MNLHNPTAEENGYAKGDTSQRCASGLDMTKRLQHTLSAGVRDRKQQLFRVTSGFSTGLHSL